MLVTALIISNTCLLLMLIFILAKIKEGLPDFQQVFDDFGEGVGSTISGLVKDPMVSRAMSTLGKKSGEVRASAALKNKVAEKALGSNILLKKALDYFDVSAIEGLELMGDPTVGPVIRNLMAGFAKGGQGLLKGFGGGGGSSRNLAVIYGREE